MPAFTRHTPKPLHGSAHRLTGCPLTRNRSNWCFALCQPKQGIGACGRAAPYAVSGRTRDAILKVRAEGRDRVAG